MTRIRTALLAINAIAFIAAGLTSAHAQKVKVTNALPSDSLTWGPAYIAEAKGYWSEAGLDVEQPLLAGPASFNAVLAGRTEFGAAAPTIVIQALAKGQKTTIIGTMGDKVPIEIVLRPDVAAGLAAKPTSSFEDRVRALKGLKLAVNIVGGFPQLYLRYVVSKVGMDPERDVQTATLQDPSQAAAMSAKSIDGIVAAVPWPQVAIAEVGGVPWISSLRGDSPELAPFAYSVEIAKPEYCAANADTCRKFTAGLTKALAFIHGNPDEAVALLKQRFPNMKPELVAVSFKAMQTAWSRTLTTDAKGMATAQSFGLTGGIIPKEAELRDLTAIYTNQYIQ